MSESMVEVDGLLQTRLSAATAGLLGVDPAVLDDQSLHDLVVAVQVERSRLAVVAAGLIGEWDQRRLYP
jgi:hypothetical protein